MINEFKKAFIKLISKKILLKSLFKKLKKIILLGKIKIKWILVLKLNQKL